MGSRLILLLWLWSAIIHVVKTFDHHDVDYIAMFGISEENDDLPSTLDSLGTQQCMVEPRCRYLPYKKTGVMVNCSYAGLHEIPHGLPNNTMRLYLRGNSIQDIADGNFANYSIMTFLDLSENKLTKLRSGAFRGLESLSSLLLSNNKIRYSNTTIQTGVFQSLVSLHVLRIQQNLRDFRNDEMYPIEALEKLKKLLYLSIDGLPNAQFTSRFRKLSKLEQLHLDGNNGRCSLTRIQKNTFVNLPQLKQLSIKNCNLKMVEKGSFSKLEHLANLDLSFNMELEFKSLENISYRLQDTNITKLNLTKIHHTFGEGTRLHVKSLKELSKTRIKYLILDSNRLSKMDTNAVKYIPRTLQGISLKDNKLIADKYIVKIYSEMHEVFKHLRVFIMSHQSLSYDFSALFHSYDALLNQNYSHHSRRHLLEDTNQNLIRENSSLQKFNRPLRFSRPIRNFEETNNRYCSNCKPHKNLSILRLPLELSFLDLSDITVPSKQQLLCICEPNKLQKLELTNNNFWNWHGAIVGTTKLTWLGLSGSSRLISNRLFDNMPNLEVLYASRNFIGFYLSSDKHGVTFRKLSKLKKLYLSENYFRYLTPKLFRGLVGLEKIFLNFNQLKKMDVHLDHMTALRYVDLHFNLLEEVGESNRNHFDKMADKHNITVNLSKNQFKCSCQYLDLIKWISKTRVKFEHFHTYTCKFDNGSTGNLTFAANIYDALSRECANYLVVILITSAAIILVLILTVGGILYRYRWDLRYMYYSTKFRLKSYTPLNIHNRKFDFDVFVSYADRDRGFVRQYLVAELEEKRGVRLLVHDRDFQAGNFVTENIMQGITTSRKTLIVMTRGFLNSCWCRYEMNMARMEAIKTGRNILCVLMKEEVPMTGLPLEIIDLIRRQTYLDIPDAAEHQEQFWNRLKASLME